MSMYAGMNFPEYEFREYPKFIQTDRKKDPRTGEFTVVGVTVNSATEEAEVTKTGKAPEREEDERARLLKVAKQNEINVDARWGAAKIEAALVAAKVDIDHDPDA